MVSYSGFETRAASVDECTQNLPYTRPSLALFDGPEFDTHKAFARGDGLADGLGYACSDVDPAQTRPYVETLEFQVRFDGAQ